MLRRLPILCALALALTLTGCSGKHGCDANSTSCTRVLFIGNSYTFVNELPGMFAKLAGSAGVNVATTMVAEGGATLADHASAAETRAALASERWNSAAGPLFAVVGHIDEIGLVVTPATTG